jgi:predicted enzyme related to lactoylglutathione lyase
MRNQHGDFIWYELLTTDLKGAVKFYSAVLDWGVEDSGQPNMDYRLAFAEDAPIAGLMTMPQEAISAGALPIWVGYVAVDDVDLAVAKIEASGGSVQMPAFDVPEVGRMAMVMDADGIPFYVMRGATDDTSDSFALNEVGHCGWNELAAKNLDGAVKFYGEQFGWTKGFEMDMGDMGAYKFFEQKGNAIGGMMQANDNAGPAMWSFYFRVADIDAAAEKIAAAGGKILHGPAQVPGDDFAINGLDPQGVLFALVGRRTNKEA